VVYINEWYPNPQGRDDGEFVELFNSGSSSVSLAGWSLWTGGRAKPHVIEAVFVGPSGYALFSKTSTKLSLKNSDGGLWLYGPGGALVDHGAFVGPAPEGKSFSRTDYGTADTQHFAFVDPTPGAPNQTIDDVVAVGHYPFGVALNPSFGFLQAFGLAVALATAVLAGWSYLAHADKKIHQLIIEGDEGFR